MFARLKRWFYGTDDDVSDWPDEDDVYQPIRKVTLEDLSRDLLYIIEKIPAIRRDITNLRTEILDSLQLQGNLAAQNADLRVQLARVQGAIKTKDVTYGNLYQAMVVEQKPKPTKKRAKK